MPMAISLLLLAVCTTVLTIPEITATNSDIKLGEKLIDTVKANHLQKQQLYRGDHDGFMPPKDPRGDQVLKVIEDLTPADIERLGKELSELQPFDHWLRDQVETIHQQPGKHGTFWQHGCTRMSLEPGCRHWLPIKEIEFTLRQAKSTNKLGLYLRSPHQVDCGFLQHYEIRKLRNRFIPGKYLAELAIYCSMVHDIMYGIEMVEFEQNYQLLRLPGGFVETPLGNISEKCYNDTIMMVNDAEEGKMYASRIAVSWGSFEYLVEKYEFMGKVQDFGHWELCLDNQIDDPEIDPYPFQTQYCQLDVLSGLKVGTCWPIVCSEEDLTTMAWEYLGWLGIIYLPWYACELRVVPWFSGAIATVTVISVFAAIVFAATLYHLTLHHYVKAKIAGLSTRQRQRKTPVSNGVQPNNYVYSQPVVEEEASTDLTELGTKIPTAPEEDNAGSNGIYEQPPNSDSKLANEKPPNKYGSVKHVTIEEGATDIMAETEVGEKIKCYAFIDNLILSSSAIFNATKYMDSTLRSPNTLCLNGLRVISMWWIILGHSFMFPAYVRIDNNWDGGEQTTKFSFRAVSESPFGVDTFFFLSGLLLSFLTLKQLAKNNGKLNWGLFYFHRFWRITPTYMLLLAVWMNLIWKWGHGPYHDAIGADNHRVCSEQWWHHLLYINNLYPFPGSVTDNVCMGWTWYLANDMQFFIISPFILYLLYRFWKVGILSVVVLFLASFGSTIYLCLHWGLGFANTGLYNDRASKDTRPGDDYIYGKPWHRIPPYLIGILFGYMLYKLKGRTIQIGWWKNILGWNIAFGTGFWVVYIGYFTSADTPQWAAVLYNTFGRTLFALSVAWVAFSCIMGYGGLVNKFLSWSVWIPLGRLSFGAYLFHPIMIYWVLYTKKTLMHWSYVDFSYFYVANVLLSYACAFVCVLLIEGPTGGLEDALLGSRRRGNKSKNK